MTGSKAILEKNMYENCRVRDMDGDIIFYCSKKRVCWYIDRNLATVLNNEPLEIQLTFKAKGKGFYGDQFYLQERSNICVSCGSLYDLSKHHIVPICFRRHMPSEIKESSHHDVVLLCYTCHEKYEVYAHKLKAELSQKYDVPVEGVWVTGKKEYDNKIRARQLALTLTKQGDKIPAERREHIIERIKSNLMLQPDANIDIDEVANIKIDRAVVMSQGEIVISKITDVDAFIQRWRQHFIDVMDPKCLPRFWSVSHKGK